MTTRDSRAVSSMPSSRSKSQERFCCAIRRRCRRLASRADDALQVRQLLVEKLRSRVSSSASQRSSALIDLVELVGEDLVSNRLGNGERQLGAATAPRPRASPRSSSPRRRRRVGSALRRIASLGFLALFASRSSTALRLGCLALAARRRSGSLRIPRSSSFSSSLVGVVAELLGHVEGGDDLA